MVNDCHENTNNKVKIMQWKGELKPVGNAEWCEMLFAMSTLAKLKLMLLCGLQIHLTLGHNSS